MASFSRQASISNRGQMYQIDFTAVNAGKQIASSKRRVRWRFGFANLEALASGQTGQDCRGEEHEVTIVWSVHSGKRVVVADGKEVHRSHSRNKMFDFSWTMRGNHVLKIVAYAQPMTENPGIRQYDFYVDGQSYFTFPKVFKLGLSPNDPRGNDDGGRSGRGQNVSMAERGGGYSNYQQANYGAPYVNGGGGGGSRGGRPIIAKIEAPSNPEEEDAYLRQAIENSLKENHSPKQSRPAVSIPPSVPEANDLLMDFMTPAAGAPPAGAPVSALVPSNTPQSYASDIFGLAPTQQQQPQQGYAQQQQQQPAYAALPPSTTPVSTAATGPTAATSDPWGMASVQSALPPAAAPQANPYGGGVFGEAAPQAPAPAPPAAAEANFFGAAPAPPPPADGNPFGLAPAPAPDAVNMFGATAPAPAPETNFPAAIGSPQPPADNVYAAAPPTPASSIGFQSPTGPSMQARAQQQPPAFGGIPEQQPQSDVTTPAESAAAPAPAAPTNPALLSMNVLSGQPQSLVSDSMSKGNGSMADQAYSKLVNMDAHDLVTAKYDASRKNPFEAMNAPIGGGAGLGASGGSSGSGANAGASLADMMKTKKQTDTRNIMNAPAPPPAGAMVLSNNQAGNFGGYGGMGGGGGMSEGMGMNQQQTMGGPPPLQQYGQQGMGMGQYGQQQTMGMGMGQQFGQQQPMGMGQQHGQQQTAGGPPPLQQYGQQQPMGMGAAGGPPPLQQSPFGF